MSLATTVAFCDEAIDIFVAHNLIPSHQHLDEDEVINVVPCELAELEEMIYFATQALQVDLSTGIRQDTLKGDGTKTYKGFSYCFLYQAEDILPTLNELVNPYDTPLTEADLHLPQS